MLVVYNGNTFVNTDNVTRATVEGKTISFYLNSGEHYHLPFDTEKIAHEMLAGIVSHYFLHEDYFNISNKGERNAKGVF